VTARPEAEAELLAALEEIGSDGATLGPLGMTFGGEPGEGNGHSTLEATEHPDVESPLDNEA
jgi:hypothetical protein